MPGGTEENDRIIYLLSGANVGRLFVFKKTERIVLAVTLLASNSPRDDFVKSHMEQKGILLLDHALEILTTGEETQFVREMIGLMSIIDLGSRKGIISVRNAAILRQECQHLLTFMYERKDLLRGTVLIEGGDFFRIEDLKMLEQKAEPWKDAVRSPFASPILERKGQDMSFKSSGGTSTKDRKNSAEAVFDIRHGDRRKKILGVITKKGRVTIKDVSEEIKDCSEKTIQRELSLLVQEGVVKKEGERRWSTYSLMR